MFNNCTNLTTPPSLPATTVADGCYNNMFSGCTSLTYAPELPAISGSSTSYWGMFANCTSLSYIKCLAEYLVFLHQGGMIYDTTSHWTYNVAPAGLFLKSSNMNDWPSGEDGIPTGWVIGDAGVTQYVYLTTSAISVDCLAQEEIVNVFSSSEWNYSTSTNWLSVSRSGNTLTIDISKNLSENDRTGVINITNTQGISNSITINQEAFDYSTENLTIEMLSNGNVSITDAFSASSSKLQWRKNNGDWSSGASMNLDVIQGDKVELISYNNDKIIGSSFNITGAFKVYGNLMSLNNNYNAQNNYQFQDLFSGCTGLTSVENLVFPNFTAQYCYRNMFKNCTDLTKAPKKIPSATEQQCCREMFAGCTSLVTAPELPATTLGRFCYQEMFSGCTNLNYVKCLATSKDTTRNSTYNWLVGVASSGTFVKSSNATFWGSGDSDIPTGWTVEEV